MAKDAVKKQRLPITQFAMLGKKKGMTQIFDEGGNVVPVTVVEMSPNVVLQKKTAATDGYWAIQLGFDDKRKQRINKAEAGHAAKAKAPVKRYLREVRLDEKSAANYEVGQELKVSLFQIGDRVDVQGTSIGKGYQGVMKRHGFAGFPASHGTHEFFRHGGSIGMRSVPGRVFKNKRMAGHMGNETVTTQNILVVGVDAENNYLLLRGSVPGAKNGYLYVKGAIKAGFLPRDFTASAAPQTEEAAAESAT